MPSDRTAFEILVREHADMLMAYLRSICDDDDLIDEAFQQTVIDTWQALESFDRTRPFAPWFRGIARNRLLVLLRTRGRLRKKLANFEQLVAARFERLEHGAADTFADRVAALRECLASLPEGQRAAIDMVYGREHDTHTAAHNLGIDWETLRKRVQRARQALADCLRTKGVIAEASS
jgi:RNA polymerase sigma-70 factor (ECF subfamily)